MTNMYIHIMMTWFLYVFTLQLQAACDTRPIIKKSKASLNSKFSFF